MRVCDFPTDADTRRIESLLKDRLLERYPDADICVYRYNPVSIRVRIISEGFKGKSLGDRDDEIAAILNELPDDLYEDISVLVCLTPSEMSTSAANFNFENPANLEPVSEIED